jgi:hypothetical protein
MAAGPFKLYWNSQLVGIITEAAFTSFPWVAGRFEARRVSKRLREVLDWFATQVDTHELHDPPFAPDLLSGWCVVDPDGERTELLAPPVIDFDKGTAEWR